jgi:hypothetical protein
MKIFLSIRRVCKHEDSYFSESIRGYQIRNQEIGQGLKVSALQQKLEKFRMQLLGLVLCMVDNTSD